MKLVVATTNPGKLREIASILNGVSTRDGDRIELVSLRDFPAIEEPDEAGATFGDNARLKALYYARATGLPSVADDSGLEIAALDNAPGVHSARWHGTDYSIKFEKIYELLAGRGSPARFVCRVALALPERPRAEARVESRVLFESEGIVSGEIAPEPKGTNGFGYDPIFFYPPFGCTLAELDLERKATVSHRGKAFQALREYLRTLSNP
jgi:XTP/dITP diphosphohydrolase